MIIKKLDPLGGGGGGSEVKEEEVRVGAGRAEKGRGSIGACEVRNGGAFEAHEAVGDWRDVVEDLEAKWAEQPWAADQHAIGAQHTQRSLLPYLVKDPPTTITAAAAPTSRMLHRSRLWRYRGY